MARISSRITLPATRLFAGAALWISALVPESAPLHATPPDHPPLPRSTPEAQGLPSAAIARFLANVAATHGDVLDSFMLVRHGYVVAEGWWEPFATETPHALYSGTKSFTSIAVGLAIAEGRLQLDDPVLGFFPAEAPAEPGNHLRAMRLRDLLTMTTGHGEEPPFRGNPALVRSFLGAPLPHPPGTHFLYNTPASDVLGIIVEKVTGASLRDYLQPRLFGPLGITDLRWANLPEGANDGGIGLSLRTGDFAAFGQLLLQKGRWQGRQLVPAEWIASATTSQVSLPPGPAGEPPGAYGFQFWRGPHNTYRADGAFGQFCLVLPDQDAVVVLTSGVPLGQMASMLRRVWEDLLPAMQPGPLPEDPAAAAGLARMLAQAARRTVADSAGTSAPAAWLGRTFAFGDNSLQLTSLQVAAISPESVELELRFNDGPVQHLACGRSRWRKGRIALGVFPEQPVAGSAGWSANDTLVAKLIFPENPFALTLTLRFSADALTVEPEWNIALGPTKLPAMTGH